MEVEKEMCVHSFIHSLADNPVKIHRETSTTLSQCVASNDVTVDLRKRDDSHHGCVATFAAAARPHSRIDSMECHCRQMVIQTHTHTHIYIYTHICVDICTHCLAPVKAMPGFK